MAIIRPPVTGNMSLDAWMDQVTKQVSLASQTADAVATAQALTSGVNPVNAVTLVLYKRYTANTLPVSEEISVETVYEYSSGTLTNSDTQSTTDFSGWSRAIPDISNGDYLYACQVNIADTAPTETIAATDWSTPVLIAAANTEGLDGFNNATVTLYQRTNSATAPADPLGTLTYTFATGSYTRTVTTDGWVDINNVGSGDYLWIATAGATSRAATHDIATTEWTVSGLSVNGVDGIDGTNGRSSAVLLIYKRATTSPTAPTGGSFNFGTSTLTAPAEWSDSIPTGDDPVYVSQGIASVIGQSGTDSSIAWNQPKLAFQNGNDGIDGQDGATGKSLFEGLIFKRSATEPSAPTGGSFDFGTNTLTPPSGWYIDIPTGSEPVWLSTGLFEVTGTTGVDNTVTWSTPTKSFQDGADGIGVDGNSVYQFSVFKRSATNPGAPTGGSFNFTTNTATAPTGWSTTAPTSDGNPLYSSTTIASVSGATGTDSTLTWSTPVVVAVDGEDGANGIDGTNGTDGNPAPRYTTVRLWFEGTEVVPGQPSATITWATSALSGISASWSTTAPTVNATGTTVAWFSDVVFNDNTGAATSTTALGTTPQRSISFDGIVTFSNSNLTDGTTTYDPAGVINNSTTTIDGSKITTGTIDVGTINATSGTFNTANIPDLNADKITAGTINVDRIAANSIDTGKISVGGVATTNIAANAVTTIGKISGTSGNVVGVQGDNTIEAVVAEVTISTTGGAITILGQARFSGLGAISNAQFDLRRDNTYLVSGGSVTYDAYQSTNNQVIFDDTVAAGTYTYKLIIRTNFNGGTIYWSNGYLQVTETKR